MTGTSDSPAANRGEQEIEKLADGVRAGDRRALGRAITLVESRRPDHQDRALALLDLLLAGAGQSVRVGISGAPGVGKSTFIEALGVELTGAGHRVAVLAVDPSSTRSGGSILGDKTRMEILSRDPAAFIRPSPSSGTLGGVARRTREAMLVCEAAGFDVIIVETIGVGQSETAVSDMVDTFLLLIAPGGGDELQGIKRGIVEIADLVVVNKADGDLAGPANIIAADYTGALHLLRPATKLWAPQVMMCSALEKIGIGDVWRNVEMHQEALRAGGELGRRREDQARHWMWSEVSESLIEALRDEPTAAVLIPELEVDVGAGKTTPGAAAQVLLDAFRMGVNCGC
jgi:LAO/AO transport system kinase